MLEKDGKILVNEINYTVEFSKFGLDISKEIIDHVEKKNEEVSS